ncbi:MAG: emp24/gp25L/p24 family protein [Candidatus Bathyarchaeota archaeon]|nr:emp24/gp25L/p24 family protein [Candidatus Bathyarchaeota archaeon]MDH5532037.1 emp24/gp25L/p24 family protein [Candidatus Bathyarchaeota archaeon]MDH5712734.1 emp24/gp25L/p24 family protein [Candidatus Bathyarchaeota archaeon]
MQQKNAVLPLTFFLIITSLITCNANATTENLTVAPESEVTKSLNLQNDDRVAIGFTVVGQTINALNFSVTDPNGDTIIQYDTVGQKSFSLHATTAGVYTLHFDNSQSLEEKMVTLNYDVQHYIMGIPQTLFYVLVIAVISVIGVAFFVLLGKGSY